MTNYKDLPKPTPLPVTLGTNAYKLVAFYFPGENTKWDDLYNAPFLGNFWPDKGYAPADVTITAEGETATFHTAEAAFQATKWWKLDDNNGNPIRQQFADCADGDAAFRLRNRLVGKPKTESRPAIPPEGPVPDNSYANLGRDGAMRTVLEAKFANAELKAGLLATGDAYLLEHNEKEGRDDYWSDNRVGKRKHDRPGELNMLGKLLMELRAKFGGVGEPTPKQEVIKFSYQVQGDTL
jgi:predicted NAD-dependent protein-ADP-ribosyltransferase YbiA (DUF1768 family)